MYYVDAYLITQTKVVGLLIVQNRKLLIDRRTFKKNTAVCVTSSYRRIAENNFLENVTKFKRVSKKSDSFFSANFESGEKAITAVTLANSHF